VNLNFSEEQRQFRDSVARFFADGWTSGDVRAYGRGEGDDRALWAGLAELGFHGALVGEDHGGLGLSFVDLVLALEEFGRALATVSAVETVVAAWLIGRHGTDEQKRRLLPAIAAGALRIAIAHQEAEAGYDPDGIATSGIRTAGGYVLDGAKILAPHAQGADCLLVSARTDAGLPAIFLCERTEAIPMARHATLDPSMPCFAVGFPGHQLPADSILGGGPDAAVLRDMADACAFAAAAMATGSAAAALDMAVAHARTRVQFGKIIGSFQAIKHKCADMAVALDAARSAIYYAAWALSQSPADAPLAISMAKAFCGDTSRMICNESLQIHGGMGFTWEYDLHLHLKRAKALEAAHGNATWHRERVASLILQAKHNGSAGL